MTVGVDVSKQSLDLAVDVCVTRFDNTASGIDKLLSNIDPNATVAMEATGRYHTTLANAAYARGHRVYVLNPKDVQRYAASTSPRATTDPIAAKIIAQFAAITEHRPYKPNPKIAQMIRDVVKARTRLVTSKVANQNLVSANPAAKEWIAPAINGMKLSIDKMNKQITQLAKQFPAFPLLGGIPGFGELISAYILALLLCGTFQRSDSFVAFIGLDLKVKESGKKAGKRCLTKRGDPEARRLLYLAARAAVRQPGPYQDIYNKAVATGWSKTAAAVIVARKRARTAWAIYTKQQPYSPDRVCSQPTKPKQVQTPPPSPDHVVDFQPNTNTGAIRVRKGLQHNKKHVCTIDNST